jgi:acyl transferase domain-containing protein
MKDAIAPVETTGLEIAIIGMAGRFPGAKNVDEFWRNLQQEKESVTFFSDEDLRSAGVDPSLLGDSKYVKAAAVLDGVDLFDAAFFDCNPREAELLDPQHRLFLEASWQALEDAGYNTEVYKGALGVYAGASKSNYGCGLSSNPRWADAAGAYQVNFSNGGDFLPTRVSYKLNLQGPSINVQTACSTSLVAVHLGCQSLLNSECDMVLAGGVSASFPRRLGYRYQEGMILSPDGHCRAFDAKAKGTVGGEGVGVVVLKRLADAVADGDSLHAIIKGSAINNDGCQKVGYTAPSVEGQAKVIRPLK